MIVPTHASLPCATDTQATCPGLLAERVDAVLSSPAMCTLRDALARAGARIDAAPILWKYLPGPTLRLMFPVVGGRIEEGAVAAVACLYDVNAARTRYAHPMHAGPHVNPLVTYLHGPMAEPKAQSGADGDRATLRMIEHKRALWQRFREQSVSLGVPDAEARWRRGYYWALKRLYFCSRCPPCRWGTPSFDGPEGIGHDASIGPDRHAASLRRTAPARVTAAAGSDPAAPQNAPTPAGPASAEHAAMIAHVVNSDAWETEAAYAARGGFRVSRAPRIIQSLARGHVQLIFPTDAAVIQGGELVAVAVTYDRPAQRVVLAHCLSAGPEAEILFMHGDVALALPPPQAGAAPARDAYRAWRRDAWDRFWLDELAGGYAQASERWLRSFWPALERLFGGNELPETRTG